METSINILTVNAGSSSIKLALFTAPSLSIQFSRRLNIAVTDIGQPKSTLTIDEISEDKQVRQLVLPNHSLALDMIFQELTRYLPKNGLAAIGNRIVHGGTKYAEAQVITTETENELEILSAFDPEHMPIAIKIIKDLRSRFPNVLLTASFDTAFFSKLPRIAQIVALPRKYEKQGLRRYGFHGLSYTYLLASLRQNFGQQIANGRVIFAHLGSGASLAATFNGLPIDTTMGFTPASGVIMSTRSGDLDPGVAPYLQKTGRIGPEEYSRIVNFESGLLGVSGLSADMLTLLNNEDMNTQAAEAVELFCYSVKKAIGALAAALGGLDTLVFSGGIGEQAPRIRRRICSGLGFLGIELDETANQQQRQLISSEPSQTKVLIIPTDEADVICAQTAGLLIEQSKTKV